MISCLKRFLCCQKKKEKGIYVLKLEQDVLMLANQMILKKEYGFIKIVLDLRGQNI